MPDRPGTPTAARQAHGTAWAARQVCGLFHDHGRLEEAVSWLEGSLFVRADMSVVREFHDEQEERASGSLGATAAGGDGRRQGRASSASLAGTLADLAVEGVAVLTGAAAAAAISSAAGASGGAVAAPDRATAHEGRAGADRAADPEGAILAVRVERPCEAERATEVLRLAGATGIWTQDRPR